MNGWWCVGRILATVMVTATGQRIAAVSWGQCKWGGGANGGAGGSKQNAGYNYMGESRETTLLAAAG